jgi:hypothetical protein
MADQDTYRHGDDSAVAGDIAIRPRPLRRISWGAIFAGVVIAMAVQLLLSMVGIGVGLGVVDPMQADAASTATSFGLGAGAWWVASNLIALLFGGYAAARLAGVTARGDGALHGIVIWGFTLLVTLYLLTTAVGSVMGGAFNVVGSTLSAAGSGLKQAVPQIAQVSGVTPDAVRERARELLNAQPSGGADPRTMSRDQAEQEIAVNLPKLASGGDQAQPARDRIVQIISAQINIPPDEANQRLDRAVGQARQTAQQAKGDAAQAADKTASVASRGALWASAALLLGAIASAFGGAWGTRQQRRVMIAGRI